MKELGQRLRDLYGNNPVQRDAFGRRSATAREIEQALTPSEDFTELERQYQPLESDLEEKVKGVQNHGKKGQGNHR